MGAGTELVRLLLLLPLSLSLLLVPTTSQAQSLKRDVVFIVDGSGSIDPSDFQLEKDGIVAAIQNPVYVPLDGSVSITVVQFCTYSTLELPTRVVETQRDVDDIASIIRNMDQIQNLTGPGLGIERATQELESTARADAMQSYCLTTDGITNTGPYPRDSLALAQSASFVLDSFAVIGVEDSHASEADLLSHYGRMPFGGGGMFVVQNAVEFAVSVGALCFQKEGDGVKLVGLEVNQVVQDMENSVKLFAEKSTVVRAFFEPQDSGDGTIEILPRLRAYNRFGTELNKSPIPAAGNEGYAWAGRNALDRRGDDNSSALFNLPPEWTAANGTITLAVEVIGHSLECKEVAGPVANDCQASVELLAPRKLKVELVKLSYYDDEAQEQIEPSDEDILTFKNRLVAIFPTTAEFDVTDGALQLSAVDTMAANNINNVLLSLELHASRSCGTRDDCFNRIFHGIIGSNGLLLDQDGLTELPGATKPPVPSVISASRAATAEDGDEYGAFTHAHELAHCFGFKHPLIPQDNEICAASSGADDSDPAFPLEVFQGSTVAAIGPLGDGLQKMIYGWDSMRREVISPWEHFALLSYCDGGPERNSSRWISSYTYGRAWEYFQTSFQERAVLTGDLCFVRGMIDLTTGQSSMLPVNRMTTETGLSTDMGSPPGDYSLVARLSNGEIAATIPFDATPVDTDTGSGQLLEIALPFVIVPGCSSNIASFEFESPEQESLAMISSSANPPTVEITFPVDGDVIPGNIVEIQWTAQDPDGDDLTFLVEYSPNNGTSWTTLAVDYAATALAVPLKDLGQTDAGLFRVTASDGFLTSQDTTPSAFRTPNTPPLVEIQFPRDGDSFFGVQLLSLEATVFDKEDRELPDFSVEWYSDLGGYIGYGKKLSLPASVLLEGDQMLNVRARDSGFAETEASVMVTVARIRQPPSRAPTISMPPTLTLAPTETCKFVRKRCSTTDECCSGLNCYPTKKSKFRCQECLRKKAMCRVHSQCCRYPDMAKCDEGTMRCVTCKGSSCVMCKTGGSMCKSPNQCCSQKCSGQVCDVKVGRDGTSMMMMKNRA